MLNKREEDAIGAGQGHFMQRLKAPQRSARKKNSPAPGAIAGRIAARSV
jgi:hypothetical protein